MIKRTNKSINRTVYLAWSIILIVVLIIFIESKIVTTVIPVAEYKSKQASLNFMNTSINQILSEESCNFSDLVRVKYDNIGKISSIETNTTEINKVQAQVSKDINNKFSEICNEDINVNLGTITGLSIFIGKGPLINFKVVPNGNVNTILSSQFYEAGINQTTHQIKLDIVADVKVIIPGRQLPITISNTYILTDTVIVGSVPDGYTYIAGDSREDIAKFNDYKADENQ